MSTNYNRFGDQGMERLEKGMAAVAKPVVKTAEDMFKDALQSLTGDYGKPIEQIEQSETKKLQEARARLAQINKEIVEARKKREQAPQAEQKPSFVPQQRDFGRARKESVLAKMIKSRQGSKEAMQRASG